MVPRIDITRPVYSDSSRPLQSVAPTLFGPIRPPPGQMTWDQIEATTPHLTYLIGSAFLILYALFSSFIRNRLHLSEPPLAMLIGVLFGPTGAGVLDPRSESDTITQEMARVVVGVQVFAIAVNLPKAYMRHHWKGVAMLVGPVMAFSWLITALFIYLLFRTDFATALVISACLAPTDPVLAASVLGNSRFSTRIPRRIRNVLGAESGCNDGTSFPFLYAGLQFIRKSGAGIALREWFLITILWQCCFGLFLGVVVGRLANMGLKLASQKKYIERSSFLAFFLLLALFTVGLGSTLGVDDFLVAFGAGTAFSWDGWFSSRTREMVLPQVLDLLLNSSMFVYFGSIIPWTHFVPRDVTPDVTPVRLLALLVLILLFRRIPVILALKPLIPDIKTYREALFCGHIGPMGLGALFLSMEARAYLENSSAIPSPHPPQKSPYLRSIELIWPITCFVVLGSVLVHGLSVLIISVGAHYLRGKEKRDNVIGGEDAPLDGMIRESEGSESDDGSAEGRPDLDEADERAFDRDGRLRL